MRLFRARHALVAIALMGLAGCQGGIWPFSKQSPFSSGASTAKSAYPQKPSELASRSPGTSSSPGGIYGSTGPSASSRPTSSYPGAPTSFTSPSGYPAGAASSGFTSPAGSSNSLPGSATISDPLGGQRSRYDPSALTGSSTRPGTSSPGLPAGASTYPSTAPAFGPSSSSTSFPSATSSPSGPSSPYRSGARDLLGSGSLNSYGGSAPPAVRAATTPDRYGAMPDRSGTTADRFPAGAGRYDAGSDRLSTGSDRLGTARSTAPSYGGAAAPGYDTASPYRSDTASPYRSDNSSPYPSTSTPYGAAPSANSLRGAPADPYQSSTRGWSDPATGSARSDRSSATPNWPPSGTTGRSTAPAYPSTDPGAASGRDSGNMDGEFRPGGTSSLPPGSTPAARSSGSSLLPKLDSDVTPTAYDSPSAGTRRY